MDSKFSSFDVSTSVYQLMGSEYLSKVASWPQFYSCEEYVCPFAPLPYSFPGSTGLYFPIKGETYFSWPPGNKNVNVQAFYSPVV